MKILPKEFKEVFHAAFLVNRKHLLWDSNYRRTAYMIAYIYRTIADSFPNLTIEYEYDHIDAVLYEKDLSTDQSIQVAIEHENDVRTIQTELENFGRHNFPLNVLVTYTGNRQEYIVKRQRPLMDKIEGDLLFILNPETANLWEDHQKGKRIPLEYVTWDKNRGELVPI